MYIATAFSLQKASSSLHLGSAFEQNDIKINIRYVGEPVEVSATDL
jgi:hypothetical protein